MALFTPSSDAVVMDSRRYVSSRGMGTPCGEGRRAVQIFPTTQRGGAPSCGLPSWAAATWLRSAARRSRLRRPAAAAVRFRATARRASSVRSRSAVSHARVAATARPGTRASRAARPPCARARRHVRGIANAAVLSGAHAMPNVAMNAGAIAIAWPGRYVRALRAPILRTWSAAFCPKFRRGTDLVHYATVARIVLNSTCAFGITSAAQSAR